MDKPFVFTIQQTADLLAISKSTIYRLIDDGHLEAVYIRSKMRIRPQAIDRYLDLQQRGGREREVRFQ